MPANGGATSLFIDWYGVGGGVGPGFHGVGGGASRGRLALTADDFAAGIRRWQQMLCESAIEQIASEEEIQMFRCRFHPRDYQREAALCMKWPLCAMACTGA